MRLLHVADVHLNAAYTAFGAAAESRRRAVIGAFRQLSSIAAAHRVDAVLVAGDLFDGPDPGVVARATAAEVFAELVAAGRPVFAVPGNHDSNLFQPNPYRDDLGGATLLLDPQFGAPRSAETATGSLHVYGLSYDPAATRDPLRSFERAPLAGVHVILLHAAVHTAPHWSGSPNALNLLREELALLEADYIALGDFHRYRDPGSFKGAPACYPGAYAAVDLTETGPRGCVVVDIETGQPPRTTLVKSGVPEVTDLGRVDISECNGLLDVVQTLVALVPEGAVPLVELVGVPRFPLDEQAVGEALIGRFGHARVRDDTRYVSSQRLDEIARQDTVAAHVVRLGRRRLEQAADDRQRRVADRALRIALREMGVE